MKTIQKNLQILVNEFSRGSINKFANDYLEERSQNLSNWISGDRNPNFEKLSKLFETIPDLSLEWFFRGKGDMLMDKENKAMAELERWKALAKKSEEDNEMLKSVLKREYANFPEGNTEGQLADDYLMMRFVQPASFNLGAFSDDN